MANLFCTACASYCAYLLVLCDIFCNNHHALVCTYSVHLILAVCGGKHICRMIYAQELSNRLLQALLHAISV